MSEVNENFISSPKKKWELVNFCEFDKFAVKSYCAIHGVDESLNLGDITKVDETKLNLFNMICGGSPCFVAGVKVYTSLGYKNIEEIQPEDMVLTHTGTFQKVLKTGNKYSDDLYEVKAQGILPTKVTGNHPYYVRTMKRVWNNTRRCYERAFSDPVWKNVNELKKDDFIGINILNTNINEKNLSKIDCWLLGRYIADGYICNSKRSHRNNSYNHKVTFCIGKNKLSDFKKAMANSMYHIGITEERTVYKCRIINKHFMDLCLQCGKGAFNKKIPYWILNLPPNMLEIFLDGYMSGDGCYIDNNYKATTISEELALGLCLCVQKIYRVGARIHKTIRKKTTVIEGRLVNQKDTYEVHFAKEKRKQVNYAVIDNIVWMPVHEVTKLDSLEQVFNLEIENDNSYTANNAIVHNCQDFSVAGKQKGSVWTCGDCGKEYNPLTVHWSKRDTCPTCGSHNIKKTRSSLLVEFLRVIRFNKPNFGIYENVKNIVGKQFRNTTFKLFEDELHEYGYNTYWKVLNAKNYGIPQNRERVYLISIRKDLDNGQFKFPEPFDNGIRLKDLLEDEVDEKYYLSDEKVQKFFKNFDQSDLPVTTRNSDISSTIRASYYKNGSRNICENIESGNGYEGVVESNNPQNFSTMSATTQSERHKSHVICSMDKSNNEPKIIDNANCITAREDRGISNRKGEGTVVLESLNYTQDTKNRYANGCYTNQSPSFTRAPLEGLSRTLKADSHPAGVYDGIRIRKLTPKECFRLMGFSDRDFEAAKNAGISNSQLYRQAGNSIVVDVLYYIYVELYKVMPYLFDDLKVSSFFSGIGAFETALDRLYYGINSGNFTNPQVIK